MIFRDSFCRPPGPPVGPLAVIATTTKTATLSWRPPLNGGGADLIGYVLERRGPSGAWVRVASLSPDTTTFTVPNLTADTDHLFRVAAENLAGVGESLVADSPVRLTLKAEHVEKITLPPVLSAVHSHDCRAERPSPPTAPLELHATGPSSILVAWGRPESDRGAPLLGYTVVLKDMRRITWMEVGQVDADTQRLQIKDLVEGKEYLVRIIARNEVGSSDPLESEEPVLVVRPPGEWMCRVGPREIQEANPTYYPVDTCLPYFYTVYHFITPYYIHVTI
ncbi:hypothetical protein LAZ67_23001757 [Cordylochernes scorpioides]|uniref:Fibronectin type-III domain-containing protein n=1 Tax=Cordylochernes scorpioides TaxID=51811 RepID=A0ABY6LQY9_9ARAC|nr:hypothetical protein LAZ67_23001757 [Cordylochernes scorpioides]